MDNLASWMWTSVPVFFAVTSNLKGRAKGLALWLYLWALAGGMALCLWRLCRTRLAASALTASDPLSQARFPYALWWSLGSLALIAILLVLPVVWYCRDRRQERVEGGTATD